jgi:hypothetical protein
MLGTIWKRWNWLDDGLIPLAVALMHVVCVSPVFAAVLRDPSTGIQSTGFVFWLCLGVVLGGAIVGRMADRNAMGAFIVVVGALAASLVALMLIVPPGMRGLDAWLSDVVYLLTHASAEALPVSLITVLFVAFLWWRGLKTVGVERDGLIRTFAIGLFVQLVLLFVGFRGSRATQGNVAGIASSPANLVMLGRVLLFLASSMAAFSLAQISHTLREQGRRTGIDLRIDRYWMVTVFSVIAGSLLLGLIIGQVISPGRFGFLRPLWNLIVQIFLLIVFILAYLFFSLLEPLLQESAQRPRSTGPRPFASFLESGESLEDLEQKPIQIPPVLFQVFQVLVILAGAALVVWLLIRALRRRRSISEVEGVVESRESVLSWDLLKSQVSSLLDGMRKRRLSPFLELGGAADDPRRVIRAIYQQILARAIELESPRGRGQTPGAYMQTLLHLCPEERSAWETITAAYQVARYGARPPTREQVRATQEAYARIDVALQKRHELSGSYSL